MYHDHKLRYFVVLGTKCTSSCLHTNHLIGYLALIFVNIFHYSIFERKFITFIPSHVLASSLIIQPNNFFSLYLENCHLHPILAFELDQGKTFSTFNIPFSPNFAQPIINLLNKQIKTKKKTHTCHFQDFRIKLFPKSALWSTELRVYSWFLCVQS